MTLHPFQNRHPLWRFWTTWKVLLEVLFCFMQKDGKETISRRMKNKPWKTRIEDQPEDKGSTEEITSNSKLQRAWFLFSILVITFNIELEFTVSISLVLSSIAGQLSNKSFVSWPSSSRSITRWQRTQIRNRQVVVSTTAIQNRALGFFRVLPSPDSWL